MVQICVIESLPSRNVLGGGEPTVSPMSDTTASDDTSDPTGTPHLGTDSDPLAAGAAVPTGSDLAASTPSQVDGGRPEGDPAALASDGPASTADSAALAEGDSTGTSASTEAAAAGGDATAAAGGDDIPEDGRYASDASLGVRASGDTQGTAQPSENV
jgi:hypothetical protein